MSNYSDALDAAFREPSEALDALTRRTPELPPAEAIAIIQAQVAKVAEILDALGRQQHSAGPSLSR